MIVPRLLVAWVPRIVADVPAEERTFKGPELTWTRSFNWNLVDVIGVGVGVGVTEAVGVGVGVGLAIFVK